MPIRSLLDEQLRGPLWSSVRRYNALGVYPLDVVRVGDPLAPPLGTPDPDLLVWAEHESRLLVTRYKRSMPAHFHRHLQSGRRSPGVLLVRDRTRMSQVLSHLTAV